MKAVQLLHHKKKIFVGIIYDKKKKKMGVDIAISITKRKQEQRLKKNEFRFIEGKR